MGLRGPLTVRGAGVMLCTSAGRAGLCGSPNGWVLPIEATNAAMYVIETSELTKQFNGRVVLHGINLQITPGEVFGYLGPNGAGKTTTVRLLLGLLKPSSGVTRVFGQDPGRGESYRARIGVLLENSGLDERMTARQCLAYHARLYGVPDPGPRIDELLRFVGLWDRRSDRIGEFSTGMKRKLGIARAICHRPDLLFLDEPSAGLDPEGQKMIRDLLLELSRRQEMTVFINSHNLPEVERLCSRIAILDRGVIRATGTIEAMREEAGSPSIEVLVGAPEQAERAASVLRAADMVEEASVTGRMVRARLNGTRSSQVIALLVREGIEVEEARRNVRTLEDVYLSIVGEREVAS